MVLTKEFPIYVALAKQFLVHKAPLLFPDLNLRFQQN